MARRTPTRRVEIENLPELRAALKELGRDAARQALMEPMRKAAHVIQRDAARRAPVADTHRRREMPRLKNSVQVEPDFKQLDRGSIAFLIGPRVFYGLFQELGWIPRGPGNRATSAERRARETGQGGTYYRAKVRGVGRGLSRGQPFLRPAFDVNKARAIYMAREGIRKRLEYVMAKHRVSQVTRSR